MVGEGAYADILLRAEEGYYGLQAMADGLPLPSVPLDVGRFLEKQINHVVYACGPLYCPDAGHGLVALFLALEAVMHAVGTKGTLAAANAAFEALTNPITETLEHMWPVLHAIAPRETRRLEKEFA